MNWSDRRGDVGAAMRDRRVLTAGMVGLFLGWAVAASGGEARPDRTALTCTNPASGAAWQIVIDPRTSTVDSHPAEMTRSRISWFDPEDGGHYTLDRRSGALTASVASSTGGYFRHARCRPLQPR